MFLIPVATDLSIYKMSVGEVIQRIMIWYVYLVDLVNVKNMVQL